MSLFRKLTKPKMLLLVIFLDCTHWCTNFFRYDQTIWSVEKALQIKNDQALKFSLEKRTNFK